MFEYLFKIHPTGGYIKSIFQIEKTASIEISYASFSWVINNIILTEKSNIKRQQLKESGIFSDGWSACGRLRCVEHVLDLWMEKKQPFQEVTFLRPISRVFFPNCNKLETESVRPRSTGFRTAKSQFAILGIPVRIRQGAN